MGAVQLLEGRVEAPSGEGAPSRGAASEAARSTAPSMRVLTLAFRGDVERVDQDEEGDDEGGHKAHAEVLYLTPFVEPA